MKNIILVIKILIFIFFGLVLVGCSTSSEEIQNWYSGEEIQNWYSGEEIIMTIKPGSLTKKGLTVIITDTTESKNIYGEDFWLEKKVDNNWKKLQTIHDDFGFNAMAYYVNENHELEFSHDWEYMYGELENGHYRLVKYFLPNIERPVTQKDQFYFSVEFDI